MHVPIWELQDILRKSFQISESIMLSLALFRLPQSVTPNSSPPNGDREIGVNPVRWEHIPTQTRLKREKHWDIDIETFVIRIPKRGLYPEFQFRGCRLNPRPGVVTKYWFQPITSRDYGEHSELYTTWEYICILIHGMAKQVTHPIESVPRSIRG